MQYNDDAQLDTSEVQDARGGGGGFGGFGGGGGLGRGGLAAGGGGLGLVGLIVVVLFNVLGGGGSGSAGSLTGGLGSLGQGSNPNSVDNSQLSSECRTGADANTGSDCAIVADIDSVQAFWASELPRQGVQYTKVPTVFFTGQTNTGCGAADSSVGPFYCPADKRVYIDLAFFDQLKTQFGATGGAFVNAYVLAHEYGHHVQDLLGIESKVNHSQTGASSDSVRLELQADCFAGVWANHATTVPAANGQPFISNLTQADITAALDTAGRIGDDWIQSHLGSGGVDQSKFTHGSSAQRQNWFGAGYRAGDPGSCNTFSARSLS
jgi:predicted metalloprotease